MSAFIPGDERILTIEDAAELQLQQDHVITLESRPPNIEGQGEIRIRELVRNALRMRPDRIIVGEVRGPETLDMLQAMNTGHEGSLTTIHANSPRDALSRLETLVLTAGVELPLRAIREQVSSAFDLLVQITRLVDGSRRISHVTEVLRMESDVITLQDIFIAKPPDEQTQSAQCRCSSSSVAPDVLRPQAELPRQAGRQRCRPPAELLHDGRFQRSYHGTGSPGLEVQGRLSVRRGRVLLTGIALVALVLPAATGAAVSLRGVDTSAYPTIHATVVSPAGAKVAPASRKTAPRLRAAAPEPRPCEGDRACNRPLAVDARQSARECVDAARSFVARSRARTKNKTNRNEANNDINIKKKKNVLLVVVVATPHVKDIVIVLASQDWFHKWSTLRPRCV